MHAYPALTKNKAKVYKVLDIRAPYSSNHINFEGQSYPTKFFSFEMINAEMICTKFIIFTMINAKMWFKFYDYDITQE